MSKVISKLSSRKLWAAIVGVVTGLAMIFGVDTSVITTVAGGVISAVSVMTYIVTEGKVDAAAVSQAVKNVQNVVEAIESDE